MFELCRLGSFPTTPPERGDHQQRMSCCNAMGGNGGRIFNANLMHVGFITTPMTQVDNQRTRTLAIDIGGSGIKVMVLDEAGAPLSERVRVSTPQPAKPDAVLAAIFELVKAQGEIERVSVGFPGVVRGGVTETAANLDSAWLGFDLATALSQGLSKPVRVANDADVQGWGAISGRGVELAITLGTGFGSALFVDGRLVPNLELAHHQFRQDETYEEQLGRATLDKVGQKKWNRRLEKAIASLQRLFNYDYLYIGGGNAKKVTLDLLPNVKIVPNEAGLRGGIGLWLDDSNR